MPNRIKNASGSQGTWAGQVIEDGAYYDIPDGELPLWRGSTQVMTDVASGDLIVNSGADTTGDILHPTDGWRYLTGDTLPKSDLDGLKLSVHPSYKPSVAGSATYAVWTGSGDEVDGNGDIVSDGDIGAGPIAHIDTEVDTAESFVDVKFNPVHGRVWLHEAYLKFTGAGVGDSISSVVRCLGTPTQQSVQLNLELDGNDWLTPASNYHLGEFNGTHGFADADQIVLVPRTFSIDGDWDFDGTTLSPNYAGTGGYKMTAIERTIHRYVNRLPCYGDTTYFSITSDETTELPEHYYLRIICHNVSNTVWHSSFIMEIYRQRTYSP